MTIAQLSKICEYERLGFKRRRVARYTKKVQMLRKSDKTFVYIDLEGKVTNR